MINWTERAPSWPATDRLRLAAVVGGLLAAAAFGLPVPAIAQDGGSPPFSLMVDTNLPAEGFITRDTAIEIRFGRALDGSERVAVFLGTIDVTDLFRGNSNGVHYDPSLMPLPSGETEIVAYLVRGDLWAEVLRRPVKVRTPRGFETARIDPGFDLSIEGQLEEGHEPAGNAPQRDTYQDFTGKLQIDSEHLRNGARFSSQSTAIAVSHRPQALRYGELGSDAPKVDLSNYVMRYERGGLALAAGHVGFGRQRHLIRDFGSRGTLLEFRRGERLDFSLAALNGTSIVGWKNIIGLNEPDHRVVGGTLGVELLPGKGALRLELTGLGASVLPLSDFNEGSVTDAEESEGFAARLEAATPGRRLRFETGLSRSAYRNPNDPTLAQEDELVPVREETRSARYLEVGLDLLRGRRLGAARTADVALVYRHERVDPLYRSIGAYIRPDILENAAELRVAVTGVQLQGSHVRSEDNLDDIESILKTRTRRSSGTIAFAVADLFGVAGPGSPWLPWLQYSLNRTHQFGIGVPVNSGFSESHVPDQVSRSQNAGASWGWGRVSFDYGFDRSDQDNRQAGRENADFSNGVHSLALGLAPHERVTLDFQLDFERAESEERDEEDRTRRYGMRTHWNVFDRTTLSVTWALTRGEDEAKTRESEGTTLDAQWSSFVPWLGAIGGQYFLRFSSAREESLDRTFGLDDERENWTVNSGLNFTFF